MAQVIDLGLLESPLRAFGDDVDAGGTQGHVAIVPVDASGAVDQELLDEWAATRGTTPSHLLTQILLDAVVDVIEGPKS